MEQVQGEQTGEVLMQKIIVADKNRLLREMLTKAISRNQNLSIVNILDSHDQLYEIAKKKQTDWVILTLPNDQDDLPLEVKEILVNFPDVGVLVVSPDGRQIRVKWLEVHEQILDGIDFDDLIKLLSAKVVTETHFDPAV